LHLQPQEECRIEVDFFPQTKRASLLDYEHMKEWHEDMKTQLLLDVSIGNEA